MGAASDGSVGNRFLGQLAGFVGGAIEPDQFWRWFALAEAAIEQHAPDELIDLANRVQSRFFEWSGSGAPADRLRTVVAADAADFGYPLRAEPTSSVRQTTWAFVDVPSSLQTGQPGRASSTQRLIARPQRFREVRPAVTPNRPLPLPPFPMALA